MLVRPSSYTANGSKPSLRTLSRAAKRGDGKGVDVSFECHGTQAQSSCFSGSCAVRTARYLRVLFVSVSVTIA
jgi:hypothetical protein